MAQQESQMEQLSGTSNLRINRPFKSDQLLVKLSRNGKEWLSPVGWVKDEKGTLLDCRSDGKTTIVEIPGEFAKKLKAGDTLSLSNPETRFQAELLWGQTFPKKANGVAAPAKVAAGAAALATGGLTIAETEKRARDAEKAAADYRAKMEAAAKAREDAQAAALEAARKADEALKAEAARITEMEQAAKAFEEAEKLRLDEQRRLDAERRLAEERKAEEARLAEEARVKAEAARLKQERSEARKFFKSEIETIKSEKTRLSTLLTHQEEKVAATELEISKTDKRLNKLENSLSRSEKTELDYQTSLKSETAKLGEIKTRQDALLVEAQEIEKGHEKLFKRLEKADMAYQKARKEADAAQARAAESLAALDTVKTESKLAIDRKDTIAAESDRLNQKAMEQKSSIQTVNTALKTSSELLESERNDVTTSRKLRESLDKSLVDVRTDIAKTQDDLGQIQKRMTEKRSALRQLEELESSAEIRQLRKGSTVIPAMKVKETVAKTDKPKQPIMTSKAKKPDVKPSATEEPGFFGRLFRRGDKADINPPKPAIAPAITSKPAVSKPDAKPAKAKAVKIETPEIKGPVVKKNLGAGEGRGYRLNNWLLLGVAVTGMAVLGTAAALTAKTPAVTTAKKSRPTIQNPVQLASTSPDLKAISLDSAAGTPEPEITPLKSEALVSGFEPSIELKPDAKPVQKEAALKPVANLEAPAPKPKTGKSAKVSPAKASPPKIRSAKTRPAIKAKPAASKPVIKAKPAASTVDYTQITRGAQENLVKMGLYNGEINGLQTVETQAAIRQFKSIFGLPVNNELTEEFVNRLNEITTGSTPSEPASDVAELSVLPQTLTPSTPVDIKPEPVQAPVQYAENTGTIVFSETAQNINPSLEQSIGSDRIAAYEAVPTTAIANPYTVAPSSDEPAKPSYEAVDPQPSSPQPSTVQTAALITPTPGPATAPVEDTIIPAKIIKAAKINYPSRALRDEKYYDVKVVVSYDVLADGKVANSRVMSIDYDGDDKYRSSFEKAAIKAVERQRFAPRTINGTAEIEKDRSTAISFKSE